MQHQPLFSSECFLFVENSHPLYITTTSPYSAFVSCVLFSFHPLFLKPTVERTFEDEISTDKNYFIFPFVQVLIFFQKLKS
jgi:hypothetical protein